MGDCAVTLKVSVENMERIDDVMEGIKKIGIGRLAKIDTEEIGFGIKVIKAVFIIPDKEGEMTKLEQAVKSVEYVSEVDTVDVNLI